MSTPPQILHFTVLTVRPPNKPFVSPVPAVPGTLLCLSPLPRLA